MKINFLILLVAALVPMIMGFIWYNPKVFGTVWKKEADVTEDKMKGANMPMIFGVSFVLSFLLAMFINFMVTHKLGMCSFLANKPDLQDSGSEVSMYVNGMIEEYGKNFRTFKHGAFHGTIAGFMFSLPIIAVNALFERKGFKYIAINAGFWIVTLAIMGGIISQYS